jgi:hypothetical protein
VDYPKSVPSVGLVNGKFVNEDTATGTQGSLIPAEWGNAVTDELLAVISAAGIDPDEAANHQVLAALQHLIQQSAGGYAADTGIANGYLAAYTPAIVVLVDGMVLKFKAKTANTGASTFKPDGVAAKPIVGGAHTALQGGEIIAGGDVWLQYNSSLDAWVLIESTGGAVQVPAAVKSQHALQLGQLATIKGIQRFTSSGSFTVPAGVTQIWVSGCAAGGGGGATLATNSSSFITGGSGGGAGQSVRRIPIAVTPGQVIPVTIGAPGTGGTPASDNATDGGATQLGAAGALLNLLGGGKGKVGSGATAFPANYGGPQGGAGYPGGSYASDTNVFSASTATGGNGGLGGISPFGAPGSPGRGAANQSVSPFAGSGYGAGGSGAGAAYTSTGSAPGVAGGNGQPGYLEIEW